MSRYARLFWVNMLDRLSPKVKAILMAAVGIGCFIIAGSLSHFFAAKESIPPVSDISVIEEVKDIYETLSPVSEPRIEARPAEWVLYVTGSVNKPGVYHLSEGARVYQLIDAAGGLTPVADEVAVNLAASLSDGSHLHVPQKGERRGEAPLIRGIDVDVIYPIHPVMPLSERQSLIDINAANEIELQTLPGVGPAIAKRIVEYRSKNGRFKQIGDLIDVPGIGGKKLEAISPLVTVK